MNCEAKFACVLVYSRIMGSLVSMTLNRSRSGRHLFFTLFKDLEHISFFNFYLFIYGCAGSSLLRGLSLVSASGGYSSCMCRLFIAMASLVVEHPP